MQAPIGNRAGPSWSVNTRPGLFNGSSRFVEAVLQPRRLQLRARGSWRGPGMPE